MNAPLPKLQAGLRVGRLTLTKPSEKRSGYHRYWICQCECGTEKVVREEHLKAGNIKSCGCLVRDTAARVHRIHGMRNTRTYNSWVGMRNRCENKKNNRYYCYGARGIKVCDRWKSFVNFLADMGERPTGFTIDRKDNDGNYEKNNCRWATNAEQNKNKRAANGCAAS